jgi:hypothetical protein
MSCSLPSPMRESLPCSPNNNTGVLRCHVRGATEHPEPMVAPPYSTYYSSRNCAVCTVCLL